MGFSTNLWRKITQNKELDQLSGKIESDFFESVYRITYITGLSSSERSIRYRLYNNFVKLAVILFVTGEMCYIFGKETSLDGLVQSLGVVLIQFTTSYRYQNLIVNKSFYNKLATSMDSPYFDISTKTRKKLVKSWAQKNKTHLIVFLFLGNSILTTWAITPLFDDIEYNLFTNIRMPFRYNTPTLYPIVYIVAVIGLIFCAYFVVVTALNTQVYLIHLLCQFTVLADCFEHVLNDCRKGFKGIPDYALAYNQQFTAKYIKRLGNLVQQHQLLLRNARDLSANLSRPMLGQLAVSGTLMCCLAYQTIMTINESVVKCILSCLYLSYNMFELYVICRWCEEISNWCLKIGQAIYCSGWERGMSKIHGVRSTILFVIVRANKPVVFTAGGMYNLTISSFASLVKASYSALTVLLRVRYN